MIYIDGQALKHTQTLQYLMINVERNIWSGKNKFLIDVGQSSNGKSEITDEKGKILAFQSDVDVMNYLFSEGWEHKTTNFTHNPTNGSQVNKILFQKR